MPFVKCPGCSQRIILSVDDIGSVLSCVSCGKHFHTTRPELDPPPIRNPHVIRNATVRHTESPKPQTAIQPTRHETRIEPLPVSTIPPAEEIQDCPYCGEAILAKARKCKHCGEMLDGESKREKPGPSSSASAATAVANININVRSHFPHVTHFILTCLTMGLWLPVWIFAYLIRRVEEY